MFRIFFVFLLVITGNVMAEKYPDDFDFVSAKYDTSGFDSLNDNEKLIYCIWWLEGEVNNGGFHQFFSNSAGDYTKETIFFLSAIEANHTVDLVKKASNVAFGGDASNDRELRIQLLEKDDEIKFKKLNLIDTEFLKYHDDLTGLVNRYLTK